MKKILLLSSTILMANIYTFANEVETTTSSETNNTQIQTNYYKTLKQTGTFVGDKPQLTKERATKLEELRKSLEEDLKTLRESITKDNIEESKTKFNSLKDEYSKKIEEIASGNDLIKKGLENRFNMFYQNNFEKQNNYGQDNFEKKDNYGQVKSNEVNKGKQGELQKNNNKANNENKQQVNKQKNDNKKILNEKITKQLDEKLNNFYQKIEAKITDKAQQIELYKSIQEKIKAKKEKANEITKQILYYIYTSLENKINEFNSNVDETIDSLLEI